MKVETPSVLFSGPACVKCVDSVPEGFLAQNCSVFQDDSCRTCHLYTSANCSFSVAAYSHIKHGQCWFVWYQQTKVSISHADWLALHLSTMSLAPFMQPVWSRPVTTCDGITGSNSTLLAVDSKRQTTENVYKICADNAALRSYLNSKQRISSSDM